MAKKNKRLKSKSRNEGKEVKRRDRNAIVIVPFFCFSPQIAILPFKDTRFRSFERNKFVYRFIFANVAQRGYEDTKAAGVDGKRGVKLRGVVNTVVVGDGHLWELN